MQTFLHLSDWVILAQDGEGPGLLGMLWPFLIIGLLFYFMLIVPQRKEQRRHKEMLDNLKKNDHVITAGGVFGIVVNVQQDSPYVTVKVDESSNTRLKILRTSISRVLAGDEKDVKDAGPETS